MEEFKSASEHHEISHAPTMAGNENIAGHADIDPDVAQYAGTEALVITDEVNKKLFWKINKRVLSVMVITYFCQSLDKGTLNFSSIMGIVDDAHLVGADYSWLGTILYLGILTGEWPTNFLLQKLPVAKYLAVNVFCWGAVVACSAAATNWPALMVVRFLLGVFESCVQPAFILMTSMWYTSKEQVILSSIWYCMTGVQLMVGGLVAYGTSHYENGVIYSWQLLFLVLGCVTCVWSVVIAWLVPDSPMKAKCFSEEEKSLIIERVRANETGIQNRKYKPYQIKEALTDVLVWCYCLLLLVANLVIGGLGNFSNLVIKSFGFSTLETQLLNIPQGVITILVMVGSAWLSTHTNQTCMVMAVWMIPPIIGTAVILAIAPDSSNAGGLLIAFYCTQFFLAEGNLIISLISRNIAGQTKKSVSLTMSWIGWAVGNIIAPQIFQANDAPRYLHGFTIHMCVYAVYACLLAFTRTLLSRRNKKKDLAAISAAGTTPNGEGEDKIKIDHSLAFEDLTDKENPNFRYYY